MKDTHASRLRHVVKGHLHIVVKGRVAYATLNRPDRLNAMGDGLDEAIGDFFEMVPYDKDVSCVLITGAGRVFCAGGDVKHMNDRATGKTEARPPGHLHRGAKRLVLSMINCEVPIVAAINGPAVGAGATVALLSDVTFVAESARIGGTHVKMGIAAGDGGSLIWPYLVSPHRAKELLFTGRLINGIEAARIGLVNHCVPDAKLMDEATAYAQEIANGSRLAVRWTKVAVQRLVLHGFTLIQDFAGMSEEMAMSTNDHREGTAAFREKRRPVFQGK